MSWKYTHYLCTVYHVPETPCRASLLGCVYVAEGSTEQKPQPPLGKVKRVPGRQRSARRSCWLVPSSRALCRQHHGTQSSSGTVITEPPLHPAPRQCLGTGSLTPSKKQFLDCHEKSHLSPVCGWSTALDSLLFNPGLTPAPWDASPQQSEHAICSGSCGFKASRQPRVHVSCFLGMFCNPWCERCVSWCPHRGCRKWRGSASPKNLNSGERWDFRDTPLLSSAACLNGSTLVRKCSVLTSLSLTDRKRHEYTSIYCGAHINSGHHLDA